MQMFICIYEWMHTIYSINIICYVMCSGRLHVIHTCARVCACACVRACARACMQLHHTLCNMLCSTSKISVGQQLLTEPVTSACPGLRIQRSMHRAALRQPSLSRTTYLCTMLPCCHTSALCHPTKHTTHVHSRWENTLGHERTTLVQFCRCMYANPTGGGHG